MRQRHRSSLSFAFVIIVLISSPAFAQEQSGSIQGIVKDSSGGVLPGVAVEARSPTVVGSSTAVTDERGVYRFPALPPATYTIIATLNGFNQGKIDNATLWLGQLLKIDFELKIGGIAETVDVVGTSPLIDVKQSAAFATVEQQALEHLPKGRDYTSTIILAPGAQYEPMAGGEAQIDGASGSENRFIVDGMDTTALVGGTSGKPVPTDFIEQVQVKSSGYAAEFGGSTGGVISAITKSGSNQIRGNAGLYYQTDAFYGDMRPVNGYNPWNSNKPEFGLMMYQTPWTYLSPIADVGGPILRDRLWYYAGLAYQSNGYHEDAIFITDPTYTKRHFEWSNFSYIPSYNITSQLTKNMRLRVTGSNQRSGERKTAPGGPGPGSTNPLSFMLPDNLTYLGSDKNLYGKTMGGYTGATFPLVNGSFDQTTYDRTWNKYATDRSNDLVSANFDWVVRPTVFVNTTAGYFRTNYWTSPDMRGNVLVHSFGNSNSDAYMRRQGYPTVPAAYQQAAGYWDGISSSGTVRDIYSRLYLNANGTWYKSAAGQHIFKAGVRLERFANDVYSGMTKPRNLFTWGRAYQTTDGRVLKGKYGYYGSLQTGTMGAVASNNVALWLQDAWTVNNRLTVNAGLRAENENIPSFDPTVPGISFGFGQKLAPRVGFAYDVQGNSKWKAYGSFGYFYDVTKLDLARAYFGAYNGKIYYWSLDTYDWKSISCNPAPTGCPGTLFEGLDMVTSYNQVNDVLASYLDRPGMTSIDPALKPYETGEFVLGIDHELSPTMSVGARYVHKWLFRTIEDVGLVIPASDTYDAGTYYMIANPGYGYSEVLVPDYPQYPVPHAARDYDAFELRLRKRFSGRWSAEVDYTYSRLYGNYSGLASSDENGRVAPNMSSYFDVIYQSYDDRQQQVFGRLATDRPHVLKLWATYDLPWGTQLGVTGITESGLPQTSTFTWQGYPVYFNGRGDLGRTPWMTQFGLQVSQYFKLGGNRRIGVELDVINLFDSNTVTGYYSTNKYRDGVKPPDSLFFDAPWTPQSVVAQYPELGVRDEVFYLTPNSFQPPREARIMVKLSF